MSTRILINFLNTLSGVNDNLRISDYRMKLAYLSCAQYSYGRKLL